MSIALNVAKVQERIQAACRACGRTEQDVQLMAVTKMHPAESMVEAIAAGLRLFRENRVQEWQQKQPDVHARAGDRGEFRVHLIGPLQSNKSTKATELFDGVDTVDSVRIAGRLNQAGIQMGKQMPVLIEVKLSEEETKHGIDPEELPGLLDAMRSMEALRPAGLITVPPWSEDAETARPYFRRLRRMRDEAVRRCPTLTQLSMGMSNDFVVAIEEGSTCVRVGTAIFGRRPAKHVQA